MGEAVREVGREGLSTASEWKCLGPVSEEGPALTTVVFGWLLDGRVLWWKAPSPGGEVVSRIPPGT